MYIYALGSFGIYMLVDDFLFVKMLYESLLWVECLSCSFWVLMVLLLNLFLKPCSFHLGSKIHLSSWMFSLHATLWRSLSFFCHKGTSCTMLNSWKWYVRCLCLKILFPCHKCFKFLILGAKPLHDVHQWEVSYLEVDTWLGGFDMTWDSL
jgi:hypothetical protein